MSAKIPSLLTMVPDAEFLAEIEEIRAHLDLHPELRDRTMGPAKASRSDAVRDAVRARVRQIRRLRDRAAGAEARPE